MRMYYVLFAFLVGLLVGVDAIATPNPEDDPFIGFTLGSDVGTSPEGKHLGFHFGPAFQLSERLTFGIGIGMESELGEAYRFRPAFGLELAYMWNDDLSFVTTLHGVPDEENPEMGLLVGLELLFHKSDVDSVSLAFLGGMLIDGQGMAAVAIHWSFTSEMFTRRLR